MAKTGDCVVKHGGSFVTGMAMVVGNIEQPLGALLYFRVCVCVCVGDRVPSVISVRRGCVTGDDVSQPTHAPVHWGLPCVWSARETSGATVRIQTHTERWKCSV